MYRRILVIDDEEVIISSIVNILQPFNFVVSGVTSTEKALEKIPVVQPELIILDLNIPSIGGEKLCKKLKSQDSTKDIPIIILTVEDTPEMKIQRLTEGADDYITKPFNSEELRARVNAILRRKETEIPNNDEVLSYKDLTVNCKEKSVKLKKREIQLNEKEFELISFLLKNKGKTFTKEAILQTVWGYSELGYSRTIDVYISQLRRKLRDYGENIKTIPKIGYQFS